MKKQKLLRSPSSNDEIDLFEVISVLWGRKWIIVCAMIISIIMALVYLANTSRIYEAKVYIGNTVISDLASINAGEKFLGGYTEKVTPSSAFSLFQKKLQSRTIALEYIREKIEPVYKKNNIQLSSNDLLDNVFLKSLSFTMPSKNNHYLQVSYKYIDPALTAEWLNGYILYSEQAAKTELISSALKGRSLAVSEFEKEIVALREIYSKMLLDKVIRMEESYTIAKNLDIQTPLDANLTGKVVSKNLDESLLYMRGYKVLGAELESLKARKLSDPFIPEVRPIQGKISYLNSIDYDATKYSIIRVDSWAEKPKNSIKPNMRLGLVVSALLGLMLGAFVVLVLYQLERRKLNNQS